MSLEKGLEGIPLETRSVAFGPEPSIYARGTGGGGGCFNSEKRA